MVSCMVMGIVFVILGAALFLKPHWLWELTEKWKSYRADEPSDLYLKSTKFGGILFAILGVVVTVLPLLLE